MMLSQTPAPNWIYCCTNSMKKIILTTLILFIVIFPVLSFAAPLIPCGTTTNNHTCAFIDLITLINNVINFILLYLALPIAAIMFAYAGVTMVTSGGSPESRTKAKSIFTNALIGLALAAGCWIIVKTFLSIMGYNDIGLFF